MESTSRRTTFHRQRRVRRHTTSRVGHLRGGGCLAHRRETPSRTCASARAFATGTAWSRPTGSTTATASIACASCPTPWARGGTTPEQPRRAGRDQRRVHLRRRHAAGNHGPVVLRSNTTLPMPTARPTFPVGTTCYVWNHQGDELEEQTLATLATAPFNKMRMCVFPKDYPTTRTSRPIYPFARHGLSGRPGTWTRFNPAFFRHLERRVGDLRGAGHRGRPDPLSPLRPLGLCRPWPPRPTTATCATWSRGWRPIATSGGRMANEYDLMQAKTMADWDRFFRIVQAERPLPAPALDPQLPRLLRPRQALGHASEHPARRTWSRRAPGASTYGKPVVIDECCYEGNIPPALGQHLGAGDGAALLGGHGARRLCGPRRDLPAPRRTSCGGPRAACCTARARRASPSCGRCLEEGPAEGLDPLDGVVEHGFPCAGQARRYYLVYCGVHQPARDDPDRAARAARIASRSWIPGR